MLQNWFVIGLDNGLLPVRQQAMILTNDDFLSTLPMKQDSKKRWKN